MSESEKYTNKTDINYIPATNSGAYDDFNYIQILKSYKISFFIAKRGKNILIDKLIHYNNYNQNILILK